MALGLAGRQAGAQSFPDEGQHHSQVLSFPHLDDAREGEPSVQGCTWDLLCTFFSYHGIFFLVALYLSFK